MTSSLSTPEPVSGPVGDERREAIAFELMLYENGEEMNWPADKVRQQLAAITEPHSGDCTKKPWTCLRCVADSVYRRADRILALPVLRGEDKGRLRQDACAPGNDVPAGFGVLPPGVRCKCIRSWRDVNGRHWCCLGPSTPGSEVEASSDDGAGE